MFPNNNNQENERLYETLEEQVPEAIEYIKSLKYIAAQPGCSSLMRERLLVVAEKLPMLHYYQVKGGDFIAAYPNQKNDPVALMDVRKQRVFFNPKSSLYEHKFIKKTLIYQGFDEHCFEYPEEDFFRSYQLDIISRFGTREKVAFAKLRGLILAMLAIGVLIALTVYFNKEQQPQTTPIQHNQ